METKSLTQEEAEEYINSGGIDCPFCDVKNSVRTNGIDSGTGVAESTCLYCEKTWTEFWKMVGVCDDDNRDNPFYLEEPKCLVRVIEAEIPHGQEVYMVCILLSPDEKTSVVLLDSDDPLSCISPRDYDTFLFNWKCELDIRIKKDDYFDPSLPDNAYENEETK